MPVTAPRLFLKRAYTVPAGLGQCVQDLVRFINDDTGFGTTGPGWALQYADDGTANSSAPVSGALTKVSELPPANLWSPANTPTDGCWVLLRSMEGNNTNRFQVVIKIETDAIAYWLCPLDDFAIPANGTTTLGSDPTFPATVLNNGFTGTADAGMGPSYLSVAADEGMFTLHLNAQSDTDGHWAYLGETDEGPGPRDYVLIVLETTDVYVNQGNITLMRALSARDFQTVCERTRWVFYGNSGNTSLGQGGSLNLLGVEPVFRLGFEAWTSTTAAPTNHCWFGGWLRNVRQSNMNLGGRGTMAGQDWMYVRQVTGRAGIAIAWDGSTVYP